MDQGYFKLNYYIIVIGMISINSVYGFFDNQPKIISENGNLVFESVYDKNITFRLKGKSYININDQNIINVIGGSGTGISSGRTIEVRIEHLEDSMKELEFQVNNYRPTGSISNGNSSGINGSDARIPRIMRRLTRLERKVNDLVTKLAIDDCRTNPCQNGGICIDLYEGYSCRCPENWEGPNCGQDVNECSNFAGTELGCQNGAECRNTPGGYNCICTSGWQGIVCNSRTTNCLSSSAGDLCGHGICVQTNDAIGYKCICEPGWTVNNLSPACTVDIDECIDSKPHCSMDPQVTCINLPGSFMCGLCPSGYSGNGHYCRDIDECETNNGGCSITPSVPCINTRGSSRCGECPLGWQGDGKNCVQSGANACSICHPNATCSNTASGVRCYCNIGFTGNGYGLDGCNNLPFNPCEPNRCMNGGTCITVDMSSYTCLCPTGFAQPNCVRPRNPCLNNPCLNGGSCITTSRNFRCRCLPSFSGNRCQRETAACGGLLTSESGTLKYPPSDTYPHNSRCAWLIRINETQVINVTFTKFNLEYSGECYFDWLQIHDGRSSSSFMIGRFCGTDLPKGGNFVTTQNTLYLWFRSDNSSAHDGFELIWDSIDPICGGYFEIDGHGTISSPGSPGNYPPNRNCEWQLMAPAGKRIQFHFFTMQIETHETCQFDYLAIYGGSTTSAPLLQKFCNTTHPEPLITPANEVLLYFHSDQDGTDAGFQIHYSVVEGTPGCGGIYTANKGEFGSPLQDGVYPHNVRCEYLISVPLDNRISIKFKEFELEESSNCYFDYVELYEGSTSNGLKIGKWCGHALPPDYTSNSNKILLIFESDVSAAHPGFRATYDIVCGGNFQEDNGVIHSPLYPQAYDEKRFCIYNIEAPLGKAIILDFVDFELEQTYYPDCDFDYLSIYDGHDSNETLIGKYCGLSGPPQIISTLNYLHLNFHSDESVGRKGFKANYSFTDIECGGVVRTPGVAIVPPMEYGNYKHDSKCKWIIVAPIDNIIQLSFTSFDLEDNSNCEYDSVTIYDGSSNINSSSSSQIGKFCGNTPPLITSSNNVLTIVFESDLTNSGEGFRAVYNFLDSKSICGGRYFSGIGTVKSPGYPNEYANGKSCEWTINAPTGQQVELIVKDFELEEITGSCNFDFLEIRNGATAASPLIGRYCGTEIPRRILSFTNQMYLKFESDSSRSFKGFKIEWNAAMTGCGGLINDAPKGSISSPNYPSPYGSNAQCDWRVTVSQGSIVQVVFVDMDLEDHSTCDFDSLELFDGKDASSKSLGKFCNENHPLLIQTTSNNLFLRLKTDVSNQGRGFDIRYSLNCSREINLHRGAIESPNFPSPYPTNLNCEWRVKIPMGNKLYVEFSHFKLEETYEDESFVISRCPFDYLEIIEKDDESIVKSEKYCRKMPNAFTSSHTEVIFKFITDSSGSENGFHLEFEVQGCGGILTKPIGNITSPNYPQPYPHNTHCEWKITTDYDHRIEVTFHDFDFETSFDCGIDGLTISNSKDEPPFSKFCGKLHTSNTPSVVTSSSHELFLKFISDISISYKGFSASYRILDGLKCGGLFSLQNGFIMSPKYPQNYDSDLYCEWLLQTDLTHNINLTFIDFDIEESHVCQHDNVKIYDGGEINEYNLLGTFCGNTLPMTKHNQTYFVSSNNKLLIVMRTDVDVAYKGFKAEYKMACGVRIIVNNTGLISHESSTTWFGQQCTWSLIAPNLNEHIILQILHLENDLDYSFSSSSDDEKTCGGKIKIYDGDSIDSPLKHELCTRKHPPPIISNGNALTIRLDMADIYYSQYFKAQYSLLDNTCGATFESHNGQIASPNYPNSYPVNAECIWNIHTSPGNRLLFTFEMIDIKESTNCNEDYLEIRENNEIGKLLGVFCGQTPPSNIQPVENLWLKFRSDNDDVGRGFLAEYSIAKFVELSGPTGVITSPLYPRGVGFTDKYEWRIEVALNHIITIIFKYAGSYTYNDLMIYDGYDTTAPEKLLTSEIMEQPIITSTNVVYITFSSNWGFYGAKFKLEWTQIERDSIKNESIANATTTSLDCNSNSLINLNLLSPITLQSPGYPEGYNTSLNCSWTFIPVKGYRVGMHFNIIDLEDVDNCLADYVTISSSRNLNEFKQLTKLCALQINFMANIFQGDPYLKVNFISDYYTNGTGFEAIVYTTCGSVLYGPNGIISKNMTGTSTIFLRPTVISRDCVWEIIVPPGRTITFELLEFSIGTSLDNCDGYLLIRNGESEESPFLGAGKYCGTSILEIPETTGNKAYIKYVKGARAYTERFILKYSEKLHDCGGSTILTTGMNSTFITSPNYPNIPSAHIECIWTIMVPNGELIKIEFVERFDLTVTQTCDQEYVELRDGGTMGASIIGRFCDKMPSTQLTTSNMLRIKYFTDVSVPRNGFKAKIQIGNCGGYYSSESGILKSPGYPGLGAYPDNSECEYIINGLEGAMLNITFLDIDLPESYEENCNDTDYIVISSMIPRNGDVEDELGYQINEIGKYCGTTLPMPILTESNRVMIKFITRKPNHEHKGFKIAFNSTRERCGGEIVAESGTITTPENLYNTALRRFCVWRITVPKGRRITLNFIDVAQRSSYATTESTFLPRYSSWNIYSRNRTPLYSRRRIYTSNSRLAFYNDHRYLSRILFITDNNYPTTVSSTDNKMLINLWSRLSGSRSFKFNFTSTELSICQGGLNGNEGTIETPRNISYYCEYVRNNNNNNNNNHLLFGNTRNNNNNNNFLGGTLAIKIKEHVSTNASACFRTILGISIRIKDSLEKEITRICSNNVTNIYDILSSPYADTRIIVRQNNFNAITSTFSIDYKFNNCGGLLESTMETIVTEPNLNYGTEITCAWLYNSIEGSDTQISLTHSQSNCDEEFIEIYNGEYILSPKTGRYCGEAVQNVIINTKGHVAYILYYSKVFSEQSKFKLQLVPSDSTCGGLIEPPMYLIKNPRNGTQYPNNAECIWEIKSNSGSHIGLQFTGRFYIEDSTNCTKDYLEIYNKNDGNWLLLDRVCGRTTPKIYNSTGSDMKIIFRSDSSISGDGFQMLWNENCGGIFMATDKINTMTSPKYPQNYPPNLYCNYTFIAPSEKFINFKFLEFELEDSTRTCIFDNLTIYRDKIYSYPLTQEKAGTYCWQNSLTQFRYKNRVTLIFATDQYFEKRGFAFEYNLDVCGGLIINSTSIESPRLYNTGKYAESLDCMWNITAPIDKKIIIRFELFDLEHGDECYMDYVDIYEGNDTSNITNRQARLCGNLTNHAPVINIDSSKSIIHFHTDHTTSAVGFNALILLIPKCDLKIELKTDRPYVLDKLTSAYAENLDCHYTVTALPGYVITLEFTDFHVAPCTQQNTSCKCDFVKVHDGAGPFAEVLGNFCGFTVPQKIISSSAALWIRFATDSVGSSTGFRAMLSMKPSLCGPEIITLNTTVPSTILVSPGGSVAYPSNTRCSWTIKTDEYEKIIEIDFERFNLQEADKNGNCNHDYLEIIDSSATGIVREGFGSTVIFSGPKSRSRTPYFYNGLRSPVAPHRYCDEGIPPTYYSSSTSINLQFVSDSEIEKSGFKLTAQIHKSCDRNYTSTQGRLYSKIVADCETYITVPENYTISLYFSYITYYTLNPPCTNDKPFFTIYDGRNNSLIEKICGASKPNPIFTDTNMLKFKMSKFDVYYQDYNAVYDITYIASNKGKGCGGTIYNYAGVFTSPMYPLNNRNYTECLWEIIVPQNTKVALQFEIFDMGTKSTCDDNYLQIIENIDNPTEYSQKYCGEDNPAPYKSRSNILHVKFKKTVNFSGTGWIINFMSVTEDSILQPF